jgi:peptidoglycan/xylan/chitin deacetylase (PgdA/CDA1 family)
VRAILTYHSVDTTGSVISVTPDVFASHVRWLASGRVAVVGLADLLARPGDDDAVTITFDDALRNFADEAWPRLRDHGLPATLFVPTGVVGGTNDWAAMPGGGMPSLPVLDWASLARLQGEGVTLGAHSRTHPDLRALPRQALLEEVDGSLEDIRRETGRRPDAFAYPYGYWNAEASAVVRGLCRLACTTEMRVLRRDEDAHLLPRLDSYYLTGAGHPERYGAASFAGYIRVRAAVRRLGQRVRAVTPQASRRDA